MVSKTICKDILINKNHYNINFVKHKFQPQKFKVHFHNSYSIGLILDGIHKLKLHDEDLLVKKGQIKIINPYESHIADGDLSWEYLNFMPTKEIIQEIAQEMCDDALECKIKFKNSINDSKATQHFINFSNSLNKNLEYEENFILLVSYLLKHYAFNDLDIKDISSNIKNSIDYIHNYYLEDISLDVLADISGISKYHFIKVFHEKTEITPHQYIINLRLEYALSLIKEKIPLVEVAFKCGFSDQSHFIRTFKKYYGITPSTLLA